MDMYVLLVGNPVDGIAVFGPFNNGEEANEWADDHLRNEEWWAVALNSPLASD